MRLKGKEFPWIFATSITTMVLNFNILAFVECIEYIMLPSRINTYGEYQGYVGLAIFLNIYLVTRNEFYVSILKDVETIFRTEAEKIEIPCFCLRADRVCSFHLPCSFDTRKQMRLSRALGDS